MIVVYKGYHRLRSQIGCPCRQSGPLQWPKHLLRAGHGRTPCCDVIDQGECQTSARQLAPAGTGPVHKTGCGCCVGRCGVAVRSPLLPGAAQRHTTTGSSMPLKRQKIMLYLQWRAKQRELSSVLWQHPVLPQTKETSK